ncbi:MAG: ABC transporter substrate-binding protein [Ideonella sp. MAG2]|nr:MAG: ABC transporter substrate-binding protein [Ideonella sp. MAG2]
MIKKTHLTLWAACAAALTCASAHAATLRWASASDIPSWDVHSQNNALGNGVHAAVYESLFYYNGKFELEPQLATGYKQLNPSQVRISLRKGVKFHDGAAFDADDVVFSLNRAMDKASNYGVYTQGIDKVVKVDEFTVDILTKGPNPVLIRQLTELRMLDKDWAEKNRSVTPKDAKSKEENYAHRHANGTGPFVLKSWDPDVKMVLSRAPNWWGKMSGNVTEIVYTPIKSDSTRVAALLSGEVDMEGTLIAPQVNGWTSKLDARYPFNQDDARKLLADAGYPNGFEVDFACPNNRYINDEEICQAVTAMWARIGVKAKLRTLPLVTYFPMIQRYEASIYMLGWGVPTFDALYSLQSLVRSVGAQGDGNYNVGRYSNPQMDALIERIKKEVDQKARNDLIEKALMLSHEEVSHIPLHNQVIPWAMKRNVSMSHRADNRIDMRTVTVN